jgi:hypothetical protein
MPSSLIRHVRPDTDGAIHADTRCRWSTCRSQAVRKKGWTEEADYGAGNAAEWDMVARVSLSISESQLS